MPFNLPAAQYLMTESSSGLNSGSFDSTFQLGRKTGGNLPITSNATQVQNGGGSEGILFGLDDQDSTSSKDASINTKVLLTSVQFNAPNRIQVQTIGNRGIVARLVSGSGGSNYREYNIGGNDTPFGASQSGPVTICLDLSATSQDSSGGSYDNSSVTKWGYGTTKLNLAGTNSNLNFFQRVFLFDTGKGEPNLPFFSGISDFDDAIAVVQGDGYTTKIGAWLTKSGSSFFVPCPLSFGNGSSQITFDDQGASVVSPSDNANNQENFRLTNNAMRVYLDTRNNAADTVVLRGAYSWGTAAPWDFDISNASSCTLSGNFTGMGRFALGGSVTASGSFTLASGEAVVCNGANVDGITVAGDLEIQGSSTTTFSSITVQGAMDFDTAGAYTLAAGSNVNEVTNSSGGTIDLVVNSSLVVTNTGPNINIIAPPKQLTLTGLQAGSEVRIYEAGTLNEIAGQETINSGIFTTPVEVPSVDIVVLSLGFQNLRLTSVDTTADAVLPIQQIADRQYRND